MANVNRSRGEDEYELLYDGSAVRAPRRREEERSAPAPQRRRRYATRPGVRIREAGRVSPFAVVGFAAVVVLSCMMLLGQVRALQVAGQVTALKTQVASLQSENVQLTQTYENTFSASAIESATNGAMSRPTADQYIYVDLSDGDNVTVYGGSDASGILSKIWNEVRDTVGNVVEYFR